MVLNAPRTEMGCEAAKRGYPTFPYECNLMRFHSPENSTHIEVENPPDPQKTQVICAEDRNGMGGSQTELPHTFPYECDLTGSHSPETRRIIMSKAPRHW